MRRPTDRPTQKRIAAAAAMLLLAACAGSPASEPATPTSKPAPAAKGSDPPDLAGPAAIPAVVIAPVEAPQEETLTARRGSGGILLVRREGQWYSLAFRFTVGDGDAANRRNEYARVAPAPSGELCASLEPVGDGYLAAWAAPHGGNSEIQGLTLDRSGKPTGEVRTLARVVEPVRWIEVLPNDGGALLLWELERQGKRELRVAPWGPREASAEAAAVATDLLAWHAVATEHGAAVVTVQQAQETKGTPVGSVELREVAADGSVGQVLVVSAAPSAHPDAQLAVVGNRYLVAWTDSRSLLGAGGAAEAGDPHVYLASIRRGSTMADTPRRPIPPVGPQALVALVANRSRDTAVLAWEPQLPRPAEQRRIHLEVLDALGSTTGPRARLDFRTPTDIPHFAAAKDGLAAITLAAASVAGAETPAAGIDEGAIVPTYVRLDETLRATASEPIRVAAFGEPGVPSSVRSLTCEGPSCTALAVGGDPQVMVTLDLRVRRAPWRPAIETLPKATPPLATMLGTVGHHAAPMADVTATRIADGRTLVAWTTDVQEPMDPRSRKKKEEEATLAFRFVTGEGVAGPVHELSQRAISVGGVASAAAVPESDEEEGAAVLAWAAPANGYPQVFVTKLGRDGQKLTQRAITRAQRHRPAGPGLPNRVSDVDIVSDGRSGYLVAWADTRDGNAEIYTARLDQRLQRKGSAQRITSAAGASTEVRIAVGADRSRLIWSDARERPDEGIADIYTAEVVTATGKKVGAERRLARTESHSRTPGIASTSRGAVAWWLEQPAAIVTGKGAGLRVLRLDDRGDPLGRSSWFAPQGRRVISAAFRCRDERCRGVMASLGDGLQQLDGIAWPDKTAPVPAQRTPLALLAEGAQDARLAPADEDLSVVAFVARPPEGGSVRYLRLRW